MVNEHHGTRAMFYRPTTTAVRSCHKSQTMQHFAEGDQSAPPTLKNSAIMDPPQSLKEIALSSSISAAKTKLPDTFAPNSYTVLCGRGKDHYNWVGNRRFRVIVNMNLERYSCARTKAEKTRIVMDVVELIHESGGTFAKRHVNGEWYDIGYDAAREKVGALFRDALQKKHCIRAGRSSSPTSSSPSASSSRPGSPIVPARPEPMFHNDDGETDALSDDDLSFHPSTLFPF
jgi:hypothetical protein